MAAIENFLVSIIKEYFFIYNYIDDFIKHWVQGILLNFCFPLRLSTFVWQQIQLDVPELQRLTCDSSIKLEKIYSK